MEPKDIYSKQPNSSVHPDSPVGDNKVKTKRLWLWIACGVAALVLAAAVVMGIMAYNANTALEEQRAENEQLMLDMARDQLEQDYQLLNDQFSQLENARQFVLDDSVKRELTEKYQAARLQVEQLQRELNDQKARSAEEIAKLRDEIASLRALLRHYVEEIDRLNKENAALRTENEEMRDKNARLTTQVTETTRRNEQLSERMVLAEKLNVSGVSLMALNRRGKSEKRVDKAVQLMVTFTITQNNSTPPGEKTFWLRIVSPSGQLLGHGGSFDFEGGRLSCTASKVVEYAGQEIGGVTIYWDVDTALTPGDYTVELFTGDYRVASQVFTLK